MESIEAPAGWVTSAQQLMKVLIAIDRHACAGCGLLKQSSLDELHKRPAAGYADADKNWKGLGFYVMASRGDFTKWHTGKLQGARARMILSSARLWAKGQK